MALAEISARRHPVPGLRVGGEQAVLRDVAERGRRLRRLLRHGLLRRGRGGRRLLLLAASGGKAHRKGERNDRHLGHGCHSERG